MIFLFKSNYTRSRIHILDLIVNKEWNTYIPFLLDLKMPKSIVT